MTRFFLSLLLPLALASLDAASNGIALLTLVDEAGYNKAEVTVDAPIVPDSTDTTQLSGSIQIEIGIDIQTDQPTALTATSGSISGTPIEFERGGFLSLLRYQASSDTLGIDISTPNPPGSVNPGTGEFDASYHQFIVNKGILTGQVTYLGQNAPINQDFEATPFGSTSQGTGTISIQLTSSTSTSKTYSVELIYPVKTTGTISQSGLDVEISTSGTVKATGSVTVPLPTAFDEWLVANDLSGSSFETDSNGDGVPNGIQWALGLSAETSPIPHLPKLHSIMDGTVRYTLELPSSGSAANLTVLFTNNIEQSFTPLHSAHISTGNPIPSDNSGIVTIDLPTGTQGYFLLQATEP